ncbi:hypothetical protein AcV5_003820 [Taiwanofungus camphoratus]|nr:hypothetical protein AcV5_003820 [Antrodia cinnamomea]
MTLDRQDGMSSDEEEAEDDWVLEEEGGEVQDDILVFTNPGPDDVPNNWELPHNDTNGTVRNEHSTVQNSHSTIGNGHGTGSDGGSAVGDGWGAIGDGWGAVGDGWGAIGDECSAVSDGWGTISDGWGTVGDECSAVGDECGTVGDGWGAVSNECGTIGDDCSAISNDCGAVRDDLGAAGEDSGAISETQGIPHATLGSPSEYIDRNHAFVAFGTRSNHQMMVVVNTSGIHQLPIHWCGCVNAPHHEDQLLDMGLYPVSHRRIKTCFTFKVLNDFLLENLKCKTSALNFYSRLRRVTNPVFPQAVPDQYQQFLRVTRQWSHLKDLMQHGFGYPSREQPGEGDLAFFCPACPQPGVNLDPDWKEHSDQLVYTRGFMMDGNFSAEHLKMRRPRNDVEITDGTGFFVAEVAKELKGQGTCHNHKAVNLANADWHKLESTGIRATACPQHGCFVPHSIMDFQKGERQINMDYSLSNAIGYNTKDIGRMLLLYDINCQYGQYLLKRFQQNPYLQMPEGLNIVKGIGLFHVHGHQDACFIRYSPSFIPGAGDAHYNTPTPTGYDLEKL